MGPSWPYTYGFRESDAEPAWPCDPVADPGAAAWYRAVDVAAEPEVVFAWLCQLRVAPYSYDWIDNGGRRSPAQRDPRLEELEIGQVVMSIFELVAYTRHESITIRTSERGRRLFGDVLVTYRLRRQASGTRLAAKLRGSAADGTWSRIKHWLFGVGDWVMMRKQLLTLRKHAEAEGG